MFVTLSRIFKYGWQGFLRNGSLSVSTIGIMILALIVFEGLILFNVVSNAAISSIQEKIDISVYFKSNVPEDRMLDIKRSLEGLSEVKFVEYVSREDALAEFKERHADDATVIQTLEELDENPLLASLNIKAKDLDQYGTIASYLEAPTLSDLIEKVTYAQNKAVIDRLTSLVATMERGVVLLTVFLAFLAALVTFNTIRLAIFSNREQIEIMRLVGASNRFIRGPYMVEGIIYGVVAAMVSFAVLIPVIDFAAPKIASFVLEIDLWNYLTKEWLRLFFYQVLFGVGLGVVSSAFAIRRYLKI
ncbi:MAG TPA: permease-like cell division protein FtsX [Candidatus Paceibacterota bacterium]|nr:permease-like cell division protein FtsX [Candidatus Paceibacterota bacterium]